MKKHSGDIQRRAFDFACRVVRLHKFLTARSSTSRILGSQMLRAGTSIGANLEEASGGQSKADFIAKCRIALKEARETHYWLRLIATCESLRTEKLDPLITEANELISILTSIIKKASLSPSRG